MFKIKRNSDDLVARYKTRLVTKGFHQEANLDYTEMFSLIVKLTTIWVLFTMALSYGWPLRQIDINNAFLYGFLNEEGFMTQPPEMIDNNKPHMVRKLRKVLYVLKQASRAWFDRLLHSPY